MVGTEGFYMGKKPDGSGRIKLDQSYINLPGVWSFSSIFRSDLRLSADFGAESIYQDLTSLLLARGRFQRAHDGHGKH